MITIGGRLEGWNHRMLTATCYLCKITYMWIVYCRSNWNYGVKHHGKQATSCQRDLFLGGVWGYCLCNFGKNSREKRVADSALIVLPMISSAFRIGPLRGRWLSSCQTFMLNPLPNRWECFRAQSSSNITTKKNPPGCPHSATTVP